MLSPPQRKPLMDVTTISSTSQHKCVPNKRIVALKGQDSGNLQQVQGNKVILARSPVQGRTPVDMKRANKKLASAVPGFPILRCEFDAVPPLEPSDSTSALPDIQNGRHVTFINHTGHSRANNGTSSLEGHVYSELSAQPPAHAACPVQAMPATAPPLPPRLVPLSPPDFIPPFEQPVVFLQATQNAAPLVGGRFSIFNRQTNTTRQQDANKENACCNTTRSAETDQSEASEEDRQRAARLA
eukprot:CAMPEP_0181293862 /NCGR_PEP_ID=MMETSP1101-20121128/3289_1 /TAXON_ID=46948 /ORGANISM="Rhodomonas abbreviata, Strain Caron Lab Isolate" /LENGTH=241 /DNA_ID=CAMNT_0023398473 /DNA_START=78 /DNA_END=799 /DNA_ORIENTATION=-